MHYLEEMLKKVTKNKRLTIGLVLVLVGVVILGIFFYPIAELELGYAIGQATGSMQNKYGQYPESYIRAEYDDRDFVVLIPKIGADSGVIKNVDPLDEKVYNKALAKGIAHALGSALPNENGNTFLFAHSAVNYYKVEKYNVQFYLLDKIVPGDKIYIMYEDKLYTYDVKEVKLVDPKEISYLAQPNHSHNLTLMTCWPAGVNYKRLLVLADKV
jgi:LPXTG-site transpeptidase (sortase) family protein